MVVVLLSNEKYDMKRVKYLNKLQERIDEIVHQLKNTPVHNEKTPSDMIFEFVPKNKYENFSPKRI